MSNREWDFNKANAYCFVAFAGLTDGEMVKSEYTAIFSAVKSWMPKDTNDDDVIECCAIAHKWVLEDIKSGGMETVAHNMADVMTSHRNWFEKQEDGGAASKAAYLRDLIGISMADDVIKDSEKEWIINIAKALNVDFTP